MIDVFLPNFLQRYLTPFLGPSTVLDGEKRFLTATEKFTVNSNCKRRAPLMMAALSSLTFNCKYARDVRVDARPRGK